jgi:hypothetical protein
MRRLTHPAQLAENGLPLVNVTASPGVNRGVIPTLVGATID